MGMKEELEQIKETQKVEPEEKDLLDPGELGTKPPDEAEEGVPSEKDTEPKEEPEKEEKEEEVPQEKVEKAKIKFKDLDDAAKKYYAAERKMHDATTEAATAKKRTAELERELSTYRTKPVTPAPAEDPVKKERQSIKDRYYSEIGKIPADDPDRDRKVFDLVGDMNDEIASLVTKRERYVESQTAAAQEAVEKRAVELGLAEDLIDDFWIYAAHVPKNLAQDDAIKWAVEKVVTPRQKVADEAAERAKKDEDEKKKMVTMGKGSTKVTTKTTDEPPASLTDMLRQSKRERVYK